STASPPPPTPPLHAALPIFCLLGAPRDRRDAAKRDPRLTHRLAVEIEGNGRGGEREFIGLPVANLQVKRAARPRRNRDLERRDRSEEHTSELQSLRHLVCRL